jgi:hypothetical protein
MLTPLPSAFAYWMFGPGNPKAELALSCWAALLVCFSIWLCWRLSVLLDVPRRARIGAVAFAALVPLQFVLEIRDGRYWEVNLAVVLLIWVLLRLAQNDAPSDRQLAFTGGLVGFLFIVSPPAGLAAGLAMLLYLVRRVPMARAWIAPGCLLFMVALFAGPWSVRNLHELGEPVALRDNFGLEFAIANHSGAVHPVNPAVAYVRREQELHPIQLMAGTRALREAGGEAAYYAQVQKLAEAWAVNHPLDFLILCQRRLVEFFLPARWFWSPYGTPVNYVRLRQFLAWATSLAGLATLAVMARRRAPYSYILVTVLASCLPYILVQPILRYRYLISTLMIFAAFDGAGRLFRLIRRQSAS